MKKFQYRLERILQLKKHDEKDKQKNLGEATQKIFNQNRKLLKFLQTRINTQGQQRKCLGGRINIIQHLGYSRYYRQLKKEELTGREILKAFEKDRERKQRELVDATKQRKIYEKLKERRHEKYIKDLELTLQKEQDELAAQSFMYKLKLPVN